ncbi:hypothetical protein ABW21_db0200235 [Orbilia brochopaga]|nr:hypothetical protein ABW21_db0200235 [Drechslerella brochopaga]
MANNETVLFYLNPRKAWSFVRRVKTSGDLRIVHNYIRLTADTMKSGYPTARIEPVINNIFKTKFNMFCANDGANGYWGVPMRASDEMKTATITPVYLLCYQRMSHGLKAACTHSTDSDLSADRNFANVTSLRFMYDTGALISLIYEQDRRFTDLVFGDIPSNNGDRAFEVG